MLFSVLKPLLLIGLAVMLIGCETLEQRKYNPKKTKWYTVWESSLYSDEVSSKDERFQTFRKNCQASSFQPAVDINGEKISDPVALQFIMVQYLLERNQERATINRIYSTSQTAGLNAVNSNNNLPGYRSYSKSITYYGTDKHLSQIPDYINILAVMLMKYERCMFKNPEWKRLRTEFRDLQTGELIDVVYD